MPLDSEPVQLEPAREQGAWSPRMVWAIFAMIVGFYGVDSLYLGYFSGWALGLRVVWAVSLLGHTALMGHVGESWGRLLTNLNVVVISSCILGLTWLMGGVGSPYFILVPAGQLVFALMYRQEMRVSMVSGAMNCAGTLMLVVASERPFVEALVWMSMVMGISMLAVFLSRQSHQAQQVEQGARLERARRESLEALALSEHRRAQSEKLALVGRLASGVAHEINNPLAYVGSNVDYVRDELRSGQPGDLEELADVLEETRAGLQHIRQIVADLKGFAHMDAHEPAECALADVVADALKLASLRLKHVAWLRVDVPVDLPEVFAVRQRLVQVVLNLLVNAGDVLESHRVQGGEVRVTGRAEGERVVLLVEDNGPGFAAHVLPRLFEAFFTTKGPGQGTGLGLNLSRELVEQFGGALTASNRPEGGARLRIEFPVRRAEHAGESSSLSGSEGRGVA